MGREVGVITITDASFSNEKDYRSQQGRCHFLGDLTEIKDSNCNRYRVVPVSFSSTTIRRVCRSTLQAETYALQHGLETGDKLRGVLAGIKGQIRSMKTWEVDARSCVQHLLMTDAGHCQTIWLRRSWLRSVTSALGSNCRASMNPFGLKVKGHGLCIPMVVTACSGSRRSL